MQLLLQCTNRPTRQQDPATSSTPDLAGTRKAKGRAPPVELQFSSLTGLTYLKAVGEARAKFGDDALLKWCTRRGLQTMYESANLCVFCCQYFHDGWKD